MMNQRIEYIDAMRGFCMFLVVYHHLALGTNLPVIGDDILGFFFLDLFFFIYGYFCPIQISVNRIKKRLKNQLLPTIICACLFIVTVKGSDWNLLYHEDKGGYWFTFVAFEILITFAILNRLLRNVIGGGTSFYLIVLFVLSYMVGVFVKIPDNQFSNIFSWGKYIGYCRPFLLGVLFQLNKERMIKLIENKNIATFVVLFFLVLVYYRKESVETLPCRNLIYSITGIFATYIMFYHSRNTLNSSTRLGRTMSYIGKHTLHIYFTHYFLLSGIAYIPIRYFIDEQLGWLVGVVILSILALFIIASCLFVEYLLRPYTPLYNLLYGERK